MRLGILAAINVLMLVAWLANRGKLNEQEVFFPKKKNVLFIDAIITIIMCASETATVFSIFATAVLMYLPVWAMLYFGMHDNVRDAYESH